MNNKYCVYLTIYKGNKLPPFYIGSSSLLRVNNGYRGSVSSKKYKHIWQQELKNKPHLFTIKILSTHMSREDATEKESKLHKQLNVRNNSLYVNMAIWHNKHLKYNGEISDQTRKIWSEQRKGRISSNKGKKFSQERKDAISKRMKGCIGFMKGKKHSDKTKQKMSEAKKGKESHRKGKHLSEDQLYRVTESNRLNAKKRIGTHHSDITKSKISKAKSNIIYEIHYPSGEVIFTDNLTSWCESQNIKRRNFVNLTNKYGKYKGYILKKHYKISVA